MTKKRLFLAINLPESVKKELDGAVAKAQEALDPSIRFVDRENWHLTVIFLGAQSDEDVTAINQALLEVGSEFEPPVVRLEKVTYGPVGRTPRMVWLVADRESSQRIAAIKAALEKSLHEKGIRFDQEHHLFTGHITLARFNAVNRETLPELSIPFSRMFEAKTIELMESSPKKSGMEYEPLSSVDFEG